MSPRAFRYHVFLSHNGRQKDWVRKLAARLRELGLTVFFDEDSIELGADIYHSIEQALRTSRHVVLVLSPEALESQWVALELSTSLYRDPAAAARTMIPVLRSDCDIPLTLARLRYLDARGDEDFDEQVTRLARAIERVPLETPAGSRVERHPLGPLALGNEPGGTIPPDSKIYIERDADRLLRHAVSRRNALCTVWGPRQVGKSSLVARALTEFRRQHGRASFVDISGLGGTGLPQVLYGVCRKVADDLALSEPKAEQFLAPGLAPQRAFGAFLREIRTPVLLAIDEVDYLRAIGELGAFFRALRAFHSSGAVSGTDTRLVISTVLSPRFFIEDELSSPFNVGEIVRLGNFSLGAASRVFSLVGAPVSDDELVQEIFPLTGGQPYLTHLAASLIRRGWSVKRLLDEGHMPDGQFSMHLTSLANRVEQSEVAKDGLRRLFKGRTLTNDHLVELMDLGILHTELTSARFSCELYRTFFQNGF